MKKLVFPAVDDQTLTVEITKCVDPDQTALVWVYTFCSISMSKYLTALRNTEVGCPEMYTER